MRLLVRSVTALWAWCLGASCAIAQTGFDPLALNSGVSPDEIARRNSDYARAPAACLGYTVPGG